RRVDPARRASRARDGVWSGKASENRSRATSGRKRSASRMHAPTTTADTASAPTHHSVPSWPVGRGTSQLRATVVATPTTSGKTTIAALHATADHGCAFQRWCDERVEVDIPDA